MRISGLRLLDDRMADSGWKTPDMVDMMLKMWSWLPLIHIMKASSPMLLNAPVALPSSACAHPSCLSSFRLHRNNE